jgi:hypothetical protein
MKNKLILPFLCTLCALFLAACGGQKAAESDSATTATADAVTSTIQQAGAKLLTTDIPPERIEGTPMPINVPNVITAPREAPRLMVPEGTELLSLNKPVTSSDDFPVIGDLDWITDGDKEAGEGFYVELMGGMQWVQIDLEQSASIAAVWVWHFHSQLRVYHNVIIQISDDPEFKTGVTTIYNNDQTNASGLGRGTDRPFITSRFGLLVDAKGTQGRYVRLYSNGNTSGDANHYIEVEVYGTPL